MATDASPPQGHLSVTGRVMRSQSGFYAVTTDDGREYTAVLRGRIKRERRETGLVALGDMVRIDLLDQPEGDAGSVDAVVAEILTRHSTLSRRAPGPKGAWAQHVVIANVDLLVPVFAVANPAPKVRMLDRFLALAEIDEIDATVVFNKSDLGVDESIRDAIDRYRSVGYAVILTSTKTGEGVRELGDALHGRVSAVVGPSGAGKSSLLNAVEPGLGLLVGAVSEAHTKGRHTTRVGELHRLSGGGLVADTPGLREIGVWQVDPGLLEWAFVEFRPYVNACKFYDCTHVHEPGCAIREALAQGRVSQERYDSYVALLAEDDAQR